MGRQPTDASAVRLSQSGTSPRVHDGEHCSNSGLHVDGSVARRQAAFVPHGPDSEFGLCTYSRFVRQPSLRCPTNWRAGCGRSASPVRREGRLARPYPYRPRGLPCAASRADIGDSFRISNLESRIWNRARGDFEGLRSLTNSRRPGRRIPCRAPALFLSLRREGAPNGEGWAVLSTCNKSG